MAHEEDDMAVNSRIPTVGDRLSVVGISFEVLVTRVVETDKVDGNGDTVFTIYIKGTTRAENLLLKDPWISSSGSIFDVVNTPDDAPSDNEDAGGGTWEIIAVTGLTMVRKYFPKHGWYDGEIISQQRNVATGQVLSTVEYEEDDDEEEMNEEEVEDGRRNYYMVPQPRAPPLACTQHVRPSLVSRPAAEFEPRIAFEAAPLEVVAATAAASSGDAPAEQTEAAAIENADAEVTEDNPAATEGAPAETAAAAEAAAPATAATETAAPAAEAAAPATAVAEAAAPATAVAEAVAPATEAGNYNDGALVRYDGPGLTDSIGLIVTQANNPGLGIDSAFCGLRSFTQINDENGKHNSSRSILTMNCGGWKAVLAHRIATPIVVATDFPGSPPGSTTLALLVAEIGVHKRSLNPNSLWRGGMYYSSRAHGAGPALFFLAAIVTDFGDSRFLGASRICGTFVVNRAGPSLRNGAFQSNLVVIPKTIIRDKCLIGDDEAATLLGVEVSALRQLWQNADAELAVFLTAGALSNNNCRNYNRASGVEGDDFIVEEEVVYDPMLQAFEEPKASLKAKAPRNRGSGNAASLSKKAKAEARLHGAKGPSASSVTSGWSDAEGEFDEGTSGYAAVESCDSYGYSAPSYASSSFGRKPGPPKTTKPSPGQVREDAAAFRMKASMQEQMLSDAARRETSQQEQFSSFLGHLKETDASKNELTSRVMEAQQEFLFRQDLNRAFTAFDNPTPLQGHMFSGLMGLRPGAAAAAQPFQQIGPGARQFEQPLAIQPTAAVLAIDNGIAHPAC